MKLKKGDTVAVTAGKDRGRRGIIEKVYEKRNTALIAGINIYKKHVKKNDKAPQGGVIDVPRPINVSKLAFICPKCKQPGRLGYAVENKKKQRVCKKCADRIQ